MPWLPDFPSGSGFKEYPSFVGAMVARSAPSMARSDERNTPSGLVSRAGSARGSVVSSCVESANDTGCLEAVRVFLNFLNQRGILFRDGSAEEASRRFLAPLLFRLFVLGLSPPFHPLPLVPSCLPLPTSIPLAHLHQVMFRR